MLLETKKIVHNDKKYPLLWRIKIVNIYTHKSKTQKYRKQILKELERGTDKLTVIAGGFNTLLLMIDIFTRPKISEGVEGVNNKNKWKSKAISAWEGHHNQCLRTLRIITGNKPLEGKRNE